MPKEAAVTGEGSSESLELFACPNGDCPMFNRFGAGNLSVAERMGKAKAIRRLYCDHCQGRFSERQGSLMRYTHLPQETVVRVVKCLTYGCSMEATADICEVDARSVRRLLDRAGPRAEDFHQSQLERLPRPPGVVELDELHAKVSKASRPPRGKKGGAGRAAPRPGAGLGPLASLVRRAATGFTWPWR